MKANKSSNEERNENVVNFTPTLITGGKGPEGYKWLEKLKVDTTFLFRPAKRSNPTQIDIGVQRARILYKFKESTLLLDDLNKEILYIVDNADFSTVMKLVEILHDPDKANEEQQQLGSEPLADAEKPAE